MIDIDEKRKKEQEILNLMIKIYCKKKHHNNKNLCESCKELMEYSNKRISKCPHMETKTFCSSCTTHCYDRKHQESIREVMRFSGPWMIFYHPIALIKHIIQTRI
ncbi:MAG: nitrous oxide-stimulated promoter family protein [Clostridiaceae bacterium]|nr:nitrous oxide-stimulated promoter family protein [Clostridiaceae bacterium]MBW4860872.1 nitrous oxide-stimulated promoter family protein [Clostridiaceae bacterium]MBW4867497.1 nitrous oxide-stimulated promoter family protein [Clostridiaceae bacterium]